MSLDGVRLKLSTRSWRLDWGVVPSRRSQGRELAVRKEDEEVEGRGEVGDDDYFLGG